MAFTSSSEDSTQLIADLEKQRTGQSKSGSGSSNSSGLAMAAAAGFLVGWAFAKAY